MGFKKDFITLSFILMFLLFGVVYGGSNNTIGYDVSVPSVNNIVFIETSEYIMFDVYEDKVLSDFKEEDDVNKTIIDLNNNVCGNKVKILTIVLMILTVISLTMKDYRRKI